ncbi:MAG: mechanosensitive ion channel family protein [Planctomycetota bacterium]
MVEKLRQAFGAFARLVAEGTPYRGPIVSLVTLVVAWLAYRLITRGLRRYVAAKAMKPENSENFFLLWRYIWLGIIVIFVLVSYSGSLATLGISAAFLGMVMGWSLQAPVTGIAAWLMVILKRPFKIGDRIIISGIVGDVIDINLTHIVLNQVGGTIGGEEKSGRGVLIPNATLFQQVVYNYNFESRYILDEVSVLVTFESDVDEAERVMREAAHGATSEIVTDTKQEPFSRIEIGDHGVRIRVRYQTLAMDRQRITSNIYQAILEEFAKTPKVEFCYPHLEVLHRSKPKPGVSVPAGPAQRP